MYGNNIMQMSARNYAKQAMQLSPRMNKNWNFYQTTNNFFKLNQTLLKIFL